MDFSEFSLLEEKLKSNLDAPRFNHTMGVAYTAAAMAMRYDYDCNRAYLAGLLHDCAKQYKTSKQIELAEKLGVTLTENEIRCPQIIHAKTGACMIKEVYGIDDEEIERAIRTHTTGEPGMDLLQKIIFIADYIEPGRDKQPRLSEIRKSAFVNLDETLDMILEDTIAYLKAFDAENIDSVTVQTFEYYHKER